ncbi:MAG: glutaredoxin [Candidatus Moranbacteria bacterium]|nr:glutaredoxin [Candidatus Moranbacteria bacterium]
MKKMSIIFLLFLSILSFFAPVSVFAKEKKTVEIIGRTDCAHCQEEEAFLRDLSARRNDVDVVTYDLGTTEGKALFDRVTVFEELSKSTPITAVGGIVIQGFESSDTTGRRIEELLDNPTSDATGFDSILSSGKGGNVEKSSGGTCEDGNVCRTFGNDPAYVSVPVAGTVDVSRYSLPALSAILGFVDGFNPCAMWVLVTFLLVLIQFGDRKKIILVAGLFLLAETIMYYLILNVWFKAWDFIGLDRIVTPIVGLIAIGGGIFFIYEWYRGDGTCLVTDVKKRAGISGQIKKLVAQPFTWITATGVVTLALSVNVIEFACSIGIPQTFTKIIEMNRLGFFRTQGYMLIYMLFYMVDDLVVFALALWGAGRLQMTEGYVKWCNLFGGALMVMLGLLLIFKPDTLLF